MIRTRATTTLFASITPKVQSLSLSHITRVITNAAIQTLTKPLYDDTPNDLRAVQGFNENGIYEMNIVNQNGTNGYSVVTKEVKRNGTTGEVKRNGVYGEIFDKGIKSNGDRYDGDNNQGVVQIGGYGGGLSNVCGVFQKDRHGGYGEKSNQNDVQSNENGSNLLHSGDYRGVFQGDGSWDCGDNSVRQNGVYGDSSDLNQNACFGGNQSAFHQNQSGSSAGKFREVLQQTSGNVTNLQQSDGFNIVREVQLNRGYGDMYNYGSQYKQILDFGENQGVTRQNEYRSNLQNSSGYGHNPNRVYGGGPLGYNQSMGGHYNQNQRLFQGNTNAFSGAKHEPFAINSARQNQSFEGHHAEGSMRSNPSANGYYRGQSREYEQNLIRVRKEGVNNYVLNEPSRVNQIAQYGAYQENIPTLQGVDGYWAHSYNEVYGGSLGDSVINGDMSSKKDTVEELDRFCNEGKLKEAIEVMDLLENQGKEIDLARYLRLVQACGEVAVLEDAKCGEGSVLEDAKAIHQRLLKSKIQVTTSVYNKILNMYFTCRSMTDAYEVFEKIPERNLTSWDTMIMGLAENGMGEDAIDIFSQFIEAGKKPDAQMFVGVFYVCGVLGDIDEGMLHFESMNKIYGIVPSMDHYLSVVDMLGSAGYLDEAMEFVRKMLLKPSVDIWETLMNLSRMQGNTELGDHCAEIIEKLDSSRLTDQARAGLLPLKASDLAKEKLKKQMLGQKKETKNIPDFKNLHEFKSGDAFAPEKDIHYALLKGLQAQMKEAGYVAMSRYVLHDVDDEIKEEALLGHSERLAVAQGFISSAARSELRIIKNLRVCGDCHNAMKLMSKLSGRRIIARDAKRWHHFEHGLCSCKDFW